MSNTLYKICIVTEVFYFSFELLTLYSLLMFISLYFIFITLSQNLVS